MGRPQKGLAEELVMSLDMNFSGEVDYTEFQAAAMDHHIEDRKDLMQAAFCGFDLDGNGHISRRELKHILRIDEHSADAILRKGDKDHDGTLNFDEFVQLLKRG